VGDALRRVNQLFLHCDTDQNTIDQDDFLVTTALNMISSCCYLWLATALVGQSIGMATVGIRIVNLNGDKEVSLSRAAIRTGSEVFTFLAWLGLLRFWLGCIDVMEECRMTLLHERA
jgi:uncharacterized RDD family membrane protein YckC